MNKHTVPDAPKRSTARSIRTTKSDLDYSAIAVTRERERHESAGIDGVDGAVYRINVSLKVPAVPVFKQERDTAGNGERAEVSVVPSTKDQVELERPASEAKKQLVEVEEGLVIDLVIVVGVPKNSHVSPSDGPTGNVDAPTVGGDK
ncbi:hypothetical protein [Mycetocola saprophilus]|uniref:hypothetical protein n=1 Tax=Mycetocola saprophilus TaxID=76636 RepID=UPI003BF23556